MLTLIFRCQNAVTDLRHPPSTNFIFRSVTTEATGRTLKSLRSFLVKVLRAS